MRVSSTTPHQANKISNWSSRAAPFQPVAQDQPHRTMWIFFDYGWIVVNGTRTTVQWGYYMSLSITLFARSLRHRGIRFLGWLS